MKALVLVSGGLDSLLAAQLIKEQGIEIIALHFNIAFCSRKQETSYGCPDSVRKTADYLGVEVKIVDIADDFLVLLKNPAHGYGSNMNPCIDCKILMLRKCKQYLQELDAAFVVTGEVLGQRPMSQHRKALLTIEKESGLDGLILRPLSAKLLGETIVEKEGWVNRNLLLNFNGRGRRPQMDLAGHFGMDDYANPAGGCLLTDQGFSGRLKDLMAHNQLNRLNLELLKSGRHFRLSGEAKLVVGRDQKEGERLLSLALEGDYIFMPPLDIAGATALGRGVFSDSLIKLSCSIVSRYFDLSGKKSAEVVYKIFPKEEEKRLNVEVFADSGILEFRI